MAGGTALALQLGHRTSLDFDFFTNERFDTNYSWEKVKKEITEEVEKYQAKMINV